MRKCKFRREEGPEPNLHAPAFGGLEEVEKLTEETEEAGEKLEETFSGNCQLGHVLPDRFG